MKNDPTGKRALFTARGGEDLTGDGKDALFSDRDRPPGRVAIECGRCGATSHLSPTEALRRVLMLSAWIPGKTFSRRITCPACGLRSWVRMRLD
jgi:transcription elongation factor Elf1